MVFLGGEESMNIAFWFRDKSVVVVVVGVGVGYGVGCSFSLFSSVHDSS